MDYVINDKEKQDIAKARQGPYPQARECSADSILARAQDTVHKALVNDTLVDCRQGHSS